MRSSSSTLRAFRQSYSPKRIPFTTRPLTTSIKMSTEANTESPVTTASDVNLDDTQRTLVSSVLDLFAGKPSLKKLALWTDDATFEDPLAKAVGRKQYQAQWYGLQTAFSEIEQLSHQVTSDGNPIQMDLTSRYVVKGVNKEQVINSKVNIFHENGKITKVEDKWDGKLPDGSFKDVSFRKLFSPFWWFHYVEAWAWWIWSFTWNTWPWQALRKLNAVTMPNLVSVPKNDAEDAKRGNQ